MRVMCINDNWNDQHAIQLFGNIPPTAPKAPNIYPVDEVIDDEESCSTYYIIKSCHPDLAWLADHFAELQDDEVSELVGETVTIPLTKECYVK